jgi:hypothetical protein
LAAGWTVRWSLRAAVLEVLTLKRTIGELFLRGNVLMIEGPLSYSLRSWAFHRCLLASLLGLP